MADVSPEFQAMWASGQHVGAAKPSQRAEIQTGRFNRDYLSWPGDPVGATIATTDPDTPWQATWAPSSLWVALPNVLDVEFQKGLESTNGLETVTLTVENIIYTAQGGNWHKAERGYLAPLRGYVAPGRDPLLDYDGSTVSENEWFQQLDRKVMLRIWQAYGDQEVKVFVGMIDAVDLTSRPDRITVTARAAKWLAEEEFFGWNKDPATGREPVVFIDRDDATNAKNVGYSATDSSDDGTDTADKMLDGDSDTFWGSAHHSVDDVTEWGQIRVPQGSYHEVVMNPADAGSDLYVSVFAKKWTDSDGNEQLPTEDGVPIPEGWVGNLDPAPNVRLDWTGSAAINDFATTEIDLSSVDTGIIVDLRVLFYITHTFDSDLLITLEAPDATVITLASGVGGGGNNFGVGTADDQMCELNDGGDTSIIAATPPYQGVFMPAEALSAVRDSTINGTWKFKVTDGVGGDVGTIHAVSMIFTVATTADPVPGANGGIPYVQHLTGVAAGKQTQDLGHTFVMGKGSIVRLSQRYYGDQGGYFQARIKTLEAIQRTVIPGHAATLWVLVDDITDVVRVILRWAGFKEWDVESAGTKLSKRLLFGKGDKYIDAINKIRDALGYVFFVADPAQDADASLGIPVFRKSLVVADNIAPKVTVKDTDLLTEIKVNHTDESLAYIIRVRGRASAQGQTLGSDPARRVQYTYRPPWSGTPSAGVIRHVVYVNHLFKTVDDCKFGAYYIALEEALSSYSAVVAIPGYPGVDLDDLIILMDLGTGMTTRLWLSDRQSRFAPANPQGAGGDSGGDGLAWTTTLTGSLTDVPDVQDVVTAINSG